MNFEKGDGLSKGKQEELRAIYPRALNVWGLQDDELLKTYWATKTLKELTALLQRPPAAIRRRGKEWLELKGEPGGEKPETKVQDAWAAQEKADLEAVGGGEEG